MKWYINLSPSLLCYRSYRSIHCLNNVLSINIQTCNAVHSSSSPLSFGEYLANKAKFYSPATEQSNIGSADISDVEAGRLEKRWKPVVAFCDNQMVDTLLRELHIILGNKPLPREQHLLDKMFEPELDDHATNTLWQSNKNEFEVSWFHSISSVASLLAYNQGSAPNRIWCSKCISEHYAVPWLPNHSTRKYFSTRP